MGVLLFLHLSADMRPTKPSDVWTDGFLHRTEIGCLVSYAKLFHSHVAKLAEVTTRIIRKSDVSVVRKAISFTLYRSYQHLQRHLSQQCWLSAKKSRQVFVRPRKNARIHKVMHTFIPFIQSEHVTRNMENEFTTYIRATKAGLQTISSSIVKAEELRHGHYHLSFNRLQAK